MIGTSYCSVIPDCDHKVCINSYAEQWRKFTFQEQKVYSTPTRVHEHDRIKHGFSYLLQLPGSLHGPQANP